MALSKQTQANKSKSRFTKYNYPKGDEQNFDKEKITITKAGKTYNVYDMIQEAREDTEIYATLEKYGCIDKMTLNAELMYGDFRNFLDLRGMQEQNIAAKNMWNNLPWEIRAKFGNNINEFVDKGEQWLKSQVDKETTAKKAAEKEMADIMSQTTTQKPAEKE